MIQHEKQLVVLCNTVVREKERERLQRKRSANIIGPDDRDRP
jgi:hypothetical protein